MSYFTTGFISYFKQLKDNNNREWFKENKRIFEEQVKIPFHHFITEMISTFEAHHEPLHVTSNQCVYRIYRDVRFSKDKTPYKTQMSAILAPGGRKNKTMMGLYLEANDEKLHLYEGIFRPSKEHLEKIRYAIAAQPDVFQNIIYNTQLTAAFTPLLGDKNKRLPKELKEAAAIQPLIYNKSFYLRAELASDLLLLENLPEIVWSYHEIAQPLNNFILKSIQ